MRQRLDLLPLQDHDPGRIAHHGRIGGNGFRYDRSGAYPRVLADVDIPKHDRVGSYHYAPPDRRMSPALFNPGAAQRHALIDGYIVANDRRFTYDYADAMVDEYSSSYRRARVYLDKGPQPAYLGDEPGKERDSHPEKEMRDLMVPESPQSLIKQYLKDIARRRIPLEYHPYSVEHCHHILSKKGFLPETDKGIPIAILTSFPKSPSSTAASPIEYMTLLSTL